MGKGNRRRQLIGSAALWLASCVAAAATECREDQIALRGDWGEARFSVDVADDDAERAQGLMHVETMPRSHGMLFVYETPRVARFWMKNTLIPLDMIFADATGTVKKVHLRAQPHSERLISGGPGIQYVLEINGGMAETLGITVGSQIRHPSIPAGTAAWAC